MNGSAPPPLPAPRLALLPAHADVLAWAAETLAQTCRPQLPDLSSLTLLLPAAAQIPRLRQQLTRHCGPILGPNITTLAGFAAQAKSASTLSSLDCKLILAEALRAHPGAFPGLDAPTLAEALFELFEELSASTPELAQDEARFLARIERGYGAQLAQVSGEAKAIHLLWGAYLRDTAGRSPAVAYAQQLRDAFAGLHSHQRLVLIGFDSFSSSEKALLREALAGKQVSVWLQGPLEGRGHKVLIQLARDLGADAAVLELGNDDCARAFDDSGTPLRQRITSSSPPRIQLAAASQTEHEARVVDLAIRQTLLQQNCDIAVVTQDRALARRLRALLERANIPLRDEAGWALSTSSVASSLGHWLDCCDGDFPFRALLNLLKSDFYSGVDPASIDQLELAIYAGKVAGGMDRLRKLSEAPKDLLGTLDAAARLLPPVHGPARNGADWSQMLMQSLKALPLWNSWENDAAGAVLIRQLEELHAVLQRQKPRLSWKEFRSMLERLLEVVGFIPEAVESPVRLLTPEQAQGLRCDLLIIAGASAAQFPGKPAAQPVFNHSVHAELGLPHWSGKLELQLARFRSLLHAAPRVLISYAADEDDESAELCPWAEALRVTGLASVDLTLPSLASSKRVEVATPSLLPLPHPAPRPALPAELLTRSLSASAHQTLIDCPYKFFASNGLGLRSPREPDEPVSRRDFGERVHNILQAFHQKRPGLPPAFTGKITAERREEIEHCLRLITYAVLAEDLRNRALAQVWLVEINSLIPDLASWMIARSDEWPLVQSEVDAHLKLDAELQLKGRIDRLEDNGNGVHGVVDYKTGGFPGNDAVLNGESVQTTHYALLTEPCENVEYLILERDKKSPKPINGDDLRAASDGVRERLREVFASLRQNAAMPAHGDALTCSRCDFRGLCRVDTWAEASA